MKKMTFDEFLNLTKVIRMLYGTSAACTFFESNINSFYALKISDLTKKLRMDILDSSHTK